MNPRITKAIVTTFAGILVAMGIALTFLPAEVGATVIGPGTSEIILALLGSALFGLGYLNWLTRQAPIGGIYGRPVLIANLVHFVVGGLALVRYCLAESVSQWLWCIAVVYVAGMVFYGALMFYGPIPAEKLAH